MAEVVVAGLGPGGAYVLYQAARAGLKAVGYDPARKYVKPCGDAVPAESLAGRLAEEAGAVKASVSEFEVRVQGRPAAFVSSRRALWYIIDKGGLVSYLRAQAEAEGARILRSSAPRRVAGLSVDARGPYARLSEAIIVYRVIARAPAWPENRVVVDFDVERLGLSWIFPAGDGLVNVGAGWLLCPSCVDEARRIVFNILGGMGAGEVLDERAAPLALEAKPSLRRDGSLAVGEAAGLVNTLSGEGIRPALESAAALGEALRSCGSDVVCVASRYERLAKRLVRQALLSRRIMGLVKRGGARRARAILESLPASFWREFFKGRMDYRMLLAAAARSPRVAVEVIKSLLFY